MGEAVAKFKMIRDGDRVAVALSGGKDSLTMLDALLLLQKRAPVDFSVCAFTVEQGKFLRPFEPMAEYLKSRGIEWTYHRDSPSFRFLEEQPDHGCDLCSRYRRRAVFDIARGLGANVIAFGHTADDICESFLRNALFNGRISALPAMTWSREKDFRMIRPLVFVHEDLTAKYAESDGRAGDSRADVRSERERCADRFAICWETRSGASSSTRNAPFRDGQRRDQPAAGPLAHLDGYGENKPKKTLLWCLRVKIESCRLPW